MAFPSCRSRWASEKGWLGSRREEGGGGGGGAVKGGVEKEMRNFFQISIFVSFSVSVCLFFRSEIHVLQVFMKCTIINVPRSKRNRQNYWGRGGMREYMWMKEYIIERDKERMEWKGKEIKKEGVVELYRQTTDIQRHTNTERLTFKNPSIDNPVNRIR